MSLSTRVMVVLSVIAALAAAGAMAVLHQHHRAAIAAQQAVWSQHLALTWQHEHAQHVQAAQQAASQLDNAPDGGWEAPPHALPDNLWQLYAPSASGASATVQEAAPVLPSRLWQLTGAQDMPTAGLYAMAPDHYVWLSLHRSPQGHPYALAQALTARLQQLQQRLGGTLHIAPLWSHSAQHVPCAAAPGVQVHCDDVHDWPRMPLVGIEGKPLGHLTWQPANWAARTEALHQAWLRSMALLGVLGAALLAVACWGVRTLLAPVSTGIAKLHQLAHGDYRTPLEDAVLDQPGEVGVLVRSIQAVRHDLLQLQTLQMERSRLRVQHERLIRHELRHLADSLDPQAREDILQALAQPPALPIQAGSSATAEQDHGLVELAGVLGRMSGLVSTQHHRLLGLLKELQASMQQQAMLASLQQELEIARQMQLSILPRTASPSQAVAIDAQMIAAKEVGGDFYDYFLIDDDHLAVVVADVSGKGVPAAFFMAISRTLLKSNALHLKDPAATMAALNDQLCAENEQMMFVTVFYAVLQISTGQMEYVNAGHNPPVYGTPQGWQLLSTKKNMALAVLEEQPFASGHLQLQQGDVLVLYTDGVTEACDTAQALFGEARLLHALTQLAPGSTIPEGLLSHIRAFECGAPQADDITVVSLRYRADALTPTAPLLNCNHERPHA